MNTYGDIRIGSMDMEYIERISESTGVDYNDADLYSLESEQPCIANDIIYYILSNALNSFDISEKSRKKLSESIYCNCLDSGFSINIDDFPKRYRNKIQKFIDQF